MNPDRTHEIIQALADGVDPYTGEPFPPDSPYQRADTVRALYAALQALTSPANATSRPAGNKAAAPKPTDPNKPRAGGPWTSEEEQRLRRRPRRQQLQPQYLPLDQHRRPGARNRHQSHPPRTGQNLQNYPIHLLPPQRFPKGDEAFLTAPGEG